MTLPSEAPANPPPPNKKRTFPKKLFIYPQTKQKPFFRARKLERILLSPMPVFAYPLTLKNISCNHKPITRFLSLRTQLWPLKYSIE